MVIGEGYAFEQTIAEGRMRKQFSKNGELSCVGFVSVVEVSPACKACDEIGNDSHVP